MVHRILAALAVAALSACGGGGGGAQIATTATSAPSSSMPASSPAPTSSAVTAAAPVAAAAALAASAPETVNAGTTGLQVVRTVDALAGGGYAVAWRSDASGNVALFMQRYDAQGAKAGGETRLAYTVGAQEDPAVAVLRDGTAVVISVQLRTDWTVFARRFDASGAALGSETIIATLPQDAAGASVQHSLAQPVVTALADGGFAAGWATVTQDAAGPVFAQHAQRFDATARAVGTPVEFAAAGPDRHLSLRLVPTPGGDFIAGTTHRYQGIGYVQYRVGTTDVGALFDADHGLLELNTTLLPLADGRLALWSTGAGGGYLQMLDAAGRALGAATSLAVIPETAVTLADGGWATVTRQRPGEPFLAQRFDAAGNAVGSRIELATGVSRPLGIARTAAGFALAWTAAIASGDTDVKTQRVEAR